MSCQNSIETGAMRKPVQWGGRGTSPMAYLAALTATAFSKREPALQRPRLLARPGADAAFARPALEIRIRLRVADPDHRAACADLPPQAFPVQHEGGLRLAEQFAALVGFRVRVENEAVLVDAVQQHHADIRQAVGIDGRESHGVRVVELGRPCLLHPGHETEPRARPLL